MSDLSSYRQSLCSNISVSLDQIPSPAYVEDSANPRGIKRKRPPNIQNSQQLSHHPRRSLRLAETTDNAQRRESPRKRATKEVELPEGVKTPSRRAAAEKRGRVLDLVRSATHSKGLPYHAELIQEDLPGSISPFDGLINGPVSPTFLPQTSTPSTISSRTGSPRI